MGPSTVFRTARARAGTRRRRHRVGPNLAVVPDDPDRQEANEWQPATSQPGELYTVEGQIASAGAFARGLKNRARRSSISRPSVLRPAAIVLALGAIVVLAAILML